MPNWEQYAETPQSGDKWAQYAAPAAAPEQSFGAALKEFGRKMNPLTLAQGLAETAAHPIEAAKAYGATNQKILFDAEDAFKRGDYGQAARHALGYVLNGIPGLGAALEEAGNKMEQGDYAGGLADTAALGSQIAIGAKAPAIARGVPAVAKATGAAVSAAAPNVAEGAARIAAGEMLGKFPGMEWPARFTFGWPGARQIGKGLGEGASAFKESLSGKIQAAGEAAAPEAAPAAAAAAVEKSPGQLMAEADGRNWNQLGAKTQQDYENIARAQAAYGPSAVKPPIASPSPSPSPAEPSPMVETVPSTTVQPGGKPLRAPLAPQPVPAEPANGPGSSIAADWVRRQIAAGKSPTADDLATALRISPGTAQKVMDVVSPAPPLAPQAETSSANVAPLIVNESTTWKAMRQENGNQIININPQAFQAYFERSNGKPLAWNEARAARLRNLESVDKYPEVGTAGTDEFGQMRTNRYGEPQIGVTDGRHRIAEAARRGQTSFPVQIEAGDKLPDSVLASPPATATPPRSLAQTEAAMTQLKEQPVVEPPTSHFNAAGEPVSPEMRTAQIVSAKTSAKAQRYAEAVQAFNKQFPEHAFTADELAVANGADRANLTAMLQRAGLLEEKETPPDASFPLILKALKIIEKRRPASSLEDLLRESIRQAQQRKGTPPGVTPIR